ncbi:MAG TPA: 3-hydroxyacyl-CoA dehydrogenase family protein [Syntrophales bacterium]|nr:3-hydroxyacyl-CoA dehydrogenase family protein [Syntrophales bacterium]
MEGAEGWKVAVLGGGGVIGSSWATNFLWRDLPVNVYDIHNDCLQTARKRIEANLDFLVNKGVLNPDEKEGALGRASYTTCLEEALSGVDFVQEAAPDDFEVKRDLLAEVDRYASPDAIFASSTSGLFITEIAADSAFPERCIVAHPYNPAHLIPLVEIGKGRETSEETVQKTCDFFHSIGKAPIVLRKEAFGFIANRLAAALYREAVDLVMCGACSLEDVDKAISLGPGIRYFLTGPNLGYHLNGGMHGIRGLLTRIGPAVEWWWEDMATWYKWPTGWMDKAHEEVLQAIEKRDPSTGRTPEEISRWRDDGLLMILRYINRI